MRFAVIFLALICLGVTSCSTPRPKGGTEAEILYKEAELLIDAGRYILATEKLNRIRSKYPYSYYATFAELLGADVLFKQENYAEAAAAYIVFKDFHPKHKKADYVTWRIGQSFFKQLPDTHDRDLSAAFEAIKYFEELERVYPNSEHIEKARKQTAKAKQMIRDKEKYIADFYFKTDVYDAARFRYRSIISDFQEPKLRSHAMVRSFLASSELEDSNYCIEHKSLYFELISKDYENKLQDAYDQCLEVEED